MAAGRAHAWVHAAVWYKDCVTARESKCVGNKDGAGAGAAAAAGGPRAARAHVETAEF